MPNLTASVNPSTSHFSPINPYKIKFCPCLVYDFKSFLSEILASNSGIEDLQATIDNLRQDQLGKKLNCTGRTKFYFVWVYRWKMTSRWIDRGCQIWHRGTVLSVFNINPKLYSSIILILFAYIKILNLTIASSRAATAYPSRAPEFIPSF
jgi:hypothetical protein